MALKTLDRLDVTGGRVLVRSDLNVPIGKDGRVEDQTRIRAVSSDIIKDPRGSIVDLTMTRVVDGDLVKIMSWYDNEWGYAAQMVRQGVHMVTH